MRSRRFDWIVAWALVAVVVVTAPRAAGAQTFAQSRVVMRDGNPTLLVDGQPFFFYGAAFFYERMPVTQWRASMLAVRAMGFNTLDLYVPWNWHEIADGDFDFDGHTNPRRNLRAVLALARELGFKLIVRPGPVIRNEWRNGGYPAWLLTRPEYGMPLHDVLEGRYPATATLQNANSDDAAAQWLANATHMTYARRWLHAVLREFTPVARQVIAVQLDDDQAAYIDNQTWPAPHLQAYLGSLEATVRDIVGLRLPVFINTYEMKVTASAPVWPMGNWYQSDAYSIGEHDRTALEFSTGLLQTQTRYPVAISEFQAGWLAQPEDPAPRPADPTNTTLALHTLLGMGARGAIDFPAQDTLNPAGWEAPFANASYAWDAALDVDLYPSARYAPTARFGDIVRENGPELAAARRLADGAIAYLTSAYDAAQITNADVFAIVARTQDAQHACRARHLVCDFVDLRFVGDATLRRYPFVIVPPMAPMHPMVPAVTARLARYAARGGRLLAGPPDTVTPVNGGIPNATVLVARDGTAFLDIVNYESVPQTVARTRITLPGGRRWDVGPLTVAARDAVLLRSNNERHARSGQRVSQRSSSPSAAPSATLTASAMSAAAPTSALSAKTSLSATSARSATSATCATTATSATSAANETVRPCALVSPPSIAGGMPTVVEDDRAADGLGRVTVGNDLISVTLAPSAGARAFWFGARTDEGCGRPNAFTSVGALRDDVEIQPQLSTTDRIGKYTRSFPAGMFNRSYRVERSAPGATRATTTFRYDAPDVVPNGATFERSVSLVTGENAFDVDERVTFAPGPAAERQRAVRYDSFDTRGATVIDERVNGALGFYRTDGTVISITWPPGDVEDAQLLPQRTSTVVRLRFAPGARRTRYALDSATSMPEARLRVLEERDRAARR